MRGYPHTTTADERASIVNGDCIGVMSFFKRESVDLILTDPPYVVRYKDRDGRSIANDDNTDWMRMAYGMMAKCLKPGGLLVSFYGFHVADHMLTACKAAGLDPVGHLVFVKGYTSSRGIVERRHEQAYIFAKGKPNRPAFAMRDVQGWVYTSNRHHPTEKPVPQLRRIIEAFCPKDGLVLDPFCGSGSTVVAALASNRDAIGIELDARWFQNAVKRIGG